MRKSIPRTNGWKLNLDKFKFKIRHMIRSMKVIEYWNKWLKKEQSLHSLMSLNKAGLSLYMTCFSKTHKMCFCQIGLHPEVKGKFMTRDLDGVREDNLMSFSVLPSMNLSINILNEYKEKPFWLIFAIWITTWSIANCKSYSNKCMSVAIKMNIFLQCLLI